MKHIHVIGGGTFNHVRTHLALAAPAFGGLARTICRKLIQNPKVIPTDVEADANYITHLHMTRMAALGHESEKDALGLYPSDPSDYEVVIEKDHPVTNQDVMDLVDRLCTDPETGIIFMTAAICDFDGQIDDEPSGKMAPRLQSRAGEVTMTLTPAEKVVGRVRRSPHNRKDIFLVTCKTTRGATDDEMFMAGLRLLKGSSCNLVLVNDVLRRQNMIVTPEQARYCVTTDRTEVAEALVEMTLSRSQGRFTRSTVKEGQPVRWDSPEIPPSLRTVVDHCIGKGAYKDLLGNDRTVGHFAVKVGENRFLTSQRNTNFNRLAETGLVAVEAVDDTQVVAYGARPSVGGQSQRIIFREHPEVDCIVHFHCPLKPEFQGKFPTRAQFAHECGSHECGQNTSDGLDLVEDGIKAVFLDHHGPNIVFHRSTDPQKVIRFIDRHFDLARHTGEAA